MSLPKRIPPTVLKKRRQFLKVASTKCAIVTPYFVLQYRLEKKDCVAQPAWAVGFTASRKVGKAVQRNFAKRRLRALVQLYAKKQNVRFFDNDTHRLDTVFIARHRLLTGEFKDLQTSFEQAMHRTLQILEKSKEEEVKG